jgi:hypothetical protein
MQNWWFITKNNQGCYFNNEIDNTQVYFFLESDIGT